MDPATRGQTIKRARRRRGYSQSVLAGLVGRSESWLSQVERGILSVDSHEILTRLARVLRLDLTELTGTEPRVDPFSLFTQAHQTYAAYQAARCGAGTRPRPGREDGSVTDDDDPDRT